MKKVCVAAAIAASVGSAPAHAEAYRLAYSKAENIEIFIDHANGAAWCGPQLNLRAVYGGTPDAAALGRLLPKIGVLLNKQCPQASDLRWTSVNSAGARVAEGTSAKASGWTMQMAAAPAAVAPAAAAPAAAAPAAAAPAAAATATASPTAAAPTAAAPAVPTPAVVATAATPAAEQAAPQAPIPPAPAAPATPPAAATAPAPIFATPAAAAAPAAPAPAIAAPAASAMTAVPAAPAPAPEPSPAPVPAAAVADVQPAAPVAVPPAPAPAPASAPAPAPQQAAFAVNGWAPPQAAAAMAGTQQLKVMQDQNGCKVISTFQLGDGAQYITLKSDGLACGPDGYATGKGRLRLERSDGARIAHTDDVWLVSGIPFAAPVNAARLAHVGENGTLWFHMDSDPVSRSHYLLRAERASYNNALQSWRYNRIDVVTESADAFRNAADIRVAVDAALRVLERTSVPDAANAQIVFSDSFEEGAIGGQTEHLLYAINANRATDWRTGKPKSEWRYNLQYAQNYLFKRDEILARKKREAQMRLANKERDNLRQYQNLVEQAKNDPQGILGRMVRDVRYQPLTGAGYGGLMAGRKATVRMVVHVDDHEDNDAVADWPYEMRLPGQKSLKEGWYLVPGDITLDPKRVDGRGLPLTLLTLGQGAPHACKKEGCADLNDPLVGARMMLGLPDWTPEQAQAVIDQATQP
ncbi:hypothetical protein [Achromobacter sp. MFA1 R4]|uniref:hypothetical protein n=1 Tax=Achromobacter sp. MFA1 R4 TaxID=1881016 RepID=UPI0009539338|nr:hypothetical protein [Achromobacter sp. MFA1 R4]SIT12625.1 hypothetical protein SAMN05428937_1084 [Achromobacter sp. MFA1 R4]